ncbi:MAG: recombinase family protein [Firmicutes bacterium]|nr:recombinase family protein [Bacillota bacterium]
MSTDKEDQANSFESQQRYFKEYIERRPNWELVEIFADEGISGTNTKKRKAFNRMIADAKSGEIDLIITKEISRFARNTLDSIYYTRELKKRGVGVIFLNDNINTLDPDAELRLTIMSSIAQEESRKTSDRVKWGQLRQMEKGVVFGRDMLGYDVRGGQLFINEEGAKIVRMIFNKFVNESKGTHVIARELREAGVTTSTSRKQWSNTVILRVIRNEKYCGDLVQKKTFTPDYLSHEKKGNRGEEEFVIMKDHHEPIISREMFDRATEILESRAFSQERKAKYSNRYAFSGKIKCGRCGASYVARYKTRQDGSRYKAWRCFEANRNGNPHVDQAGNQLGCFGEGLRDEDAFHIMRLVCGSLDFERDIILSNLVHAIDSVIKEEYGAVDTARLVEKIGQVDEKRSRLIELYMSGDIDKEQFITARDKCDTEAAEIKSLIESIEQRERLHEAQQTLLCDIKDALDEMISGITHDEEFYRSILNKMVVHDKDHIDVYLNLLPFKWSYAIAKASKMGVNDKRNIFDTEIPMSVSSPLSSA